MSGRRVRELTPRELAMVNLVGSFRVVSGGQVQALCFPDGSVIGTRRRTQAHLKRLVDEHYLTRLQRRVGGIRAGSASFCYCLGSRGLRLRDPSVRARRAAEPGSSFVAHHLAIVDVYVGLVEAERRQELEILDHQTEPTCWRLTPRGLGGSEWLKPDLFVSLGVGDLELRWFIEVDLGTESLARVDRTCDRYVAYYRSGREQADHEVFPKVAWLTTSTRRAEAIGSHVARRPDHEQLLFRVGSLDDSTRTLMGGEG